MGPWASSFTSWQTNEVVLKNYLNYFSDQDWGSPVSKCLLYENFFSSVQSLSHVRLFATPWTAPYQASLSITNSWSLLKLMSIELVMPSNHLILCRPLLLLPSIFPSIRVFSNESVLHIRWPKVVEFQLQHQFSSVAQSCTTLCDPMNCRPPCPSPTPGVHSNSCPSSQ